MLDVVRPKHHKLRILLELTSTHVYIVLEVGCRTRHEVAHIPLVPEGH